MGEKYEVSMEYGIHVITPEWIHQCVIKQGILEQQKPHPVRSTNIEDIL